MNWRITPSRSSAGSPIRRTEPPDLTIDPPNANAAMGQTVAYTVHASPADAGQPATVAVTGPAVLTDATGKQQLGQQQDVTLDTQSAAQFWVTSTGAGQTNVNVALPYRLEAGTVFSHIEGNQPTQRLVMAESQNLVAHATAQGIWSGQAPSPSTPPTETPAAATETPAAAIETPAPPTETPKHHSSKSPTETPTSGEQSSPTATVQETPAVLSNEQATATPQVPPAQATGGAAPVQPRSLPRTGELAGPALWLILVGGAVLSASGWLLRRRALRKKPDEGRNIT